MRPTAQYRIHFIDNNGEGIIDCITISGLNEALKNLHDDPSVEEIWEETWNDDMGWN